MAMQYQLFMVMLIGLVLGLCLWGAYRLFLMRERHIVSVVAVGEGQKPARPLVRRAVFEYKLAKATAHSMKSHEGVTVFFIGMDGSKRINQEFGYETGDRILRSVAHRLRALPDTFDCVAYLGGDEFAAYVQAPVDRLLAQTIAKRVMVAVAYPHDFLDVVITSTCSIGISEYPTYNLPSELLAYAHLAMCAAKTAGAGSYAFYSGESKSLADEALALARDLRGAISRGELHLVFQPKIDAKSGRITAVEALLRWTHPQRGLVSPVVFIPIAERFGYIDEIGDWVIDEACRQARIWRGKGLRMRIAVNLSARQLLQANLPKRIRGILNRHQIHPSLLTCEITESVAIEGTEANRSTLFSLQKAGMHISLDDFGTGYSSLSYLRELPAREVKIDRSFITDLGDSEHAHSIVDAVIRMSHALGKRVVAEGVENKRQMDILMELGCDELQGYYLARPMTPELLLRWALSPPDGALRFHPVVFGETQPQDLVSDSIFARESEYSGLIQLRSAS